MSEFSQDIKRSLEVLYGEYDPKKELERFTVRWGGFDQQALAQALSQGKGEERLLAICVLGASGFPQVRALLHPFLQSSDPKERWLSAVMLGRMREQEAFPTLVTLLTEYLPSEASPVFVEDQMWFDEMRCDVANTLARWEDPSLVPIFRQAFVTNIKAMQYAPEKENRYQYMYLEPWHIFQDILMDTLGRWEAFGVLTGLELPSIHLRLAVVNMARGYCRLENHPDIAQLRLAFLWLDHTGVRQELKTVLRQRFGLTEEEQDRYLDGYREDYYIRKNAPFDTGWP